MSQAGFGDSSSQESINLSELESPFSSESPKLTDEPSTLFKALPRQMLEQELRFCNERSQQAQVLLRQAQEQLQLSQLVIQRQETLTLTLQSRIDQLERELQDTHSNCDELRNRLKRQQHHTSQLKAALERCLDTSTTATNDMALSALESWSIAKLADEKISPVESINNDSQLENVIKITPTPQEPDNSDSQASDLFNTESPTFKLSAEPDNSTIPTKSQPISPLIVRPHKASQGSPIVPNLPALQNVGESSEDTRSVVKDEPRELEEASVASGLTLGNSAVVSTVATPKFMQSLYSNTHYSANVDPETNEPEYLAAKADSRKAVTSLAAVQLPQFPPLPRRQR
ncbi:MAG: hypothetical protein DCE90_15435 [Pseudanabaena sp.]|nr:MAG: hypothetical protein DCE90_15435 [Pseudanabaena sp.]